MDYNEQENDIRESMDLQTVQFVSYLIKNIHEYEKNNIKITPFCNEFITNSKNNLLHKIPKTASRLKLELLTKLLPLKLDDEYVSVGKGLNREFNFICVMFMDIVSYTELAKRYDGDTIFKLLDEVYSHFDTIIKKYSNLQKIETIGDAYMVVGDIYRQELNYKVVVKEIIFLGMEFIKEIKNINTSDNIPLCIRVGINIGNVNVGILGNEIPRLCVVGNTVNVASRLQSTADPDTIQISRHVHEHVGEIDFVIPIYFQEKQNTFLKNIGSVTTYILQP